MPFSELDIGRKKNFSVPLWLQKKDEKRKMRVRRERAKFENAFGLRGRKNE